jgi:hypothetical protein
MSSTRNTFSGADRGDHHFPTTSLQPDAACVVRMFPSVTMNPSLIVTPSFQPDACRGRSRADRQEQFSQVNL